MSNAVPQANTRTNTLAAIALVLGFVFPLLAIPVGHVARRQMPTPASGATDWR